MNNAGRFSCDRILLSQCQWQAWSNPTNHSRACPIRFRCGHISLQLLGVNQGRRNEDEFALLVACPKGLHTKMPAAPVRRHAASRRTF
jgi:hypothetical protein